MAVARCQTAEDGLSPRVPEVTLHGEGTDREFLRVLMRVGRPWACTDFDRRLVICASQVTDVVTAALERGE